jgi:hypothetical protein
MTRRVVWYDSDLGHVRILVPYFDAPEVRLAGESDDDFLARVIAKSVPDGMTYHIVEHTDLPTDRYFRNAWEWSD